MRANEFLVGGRYRTRNQAYEVLQRQVDQIRVRYDDLTEAWLDADVAARIHTNIQREEAGAYPRLLPNGRNHDFAWTLGVIARHGELHAEVPPQSWHGFEQTYRNTTGVANVASVPCIERITTGGDNKWGCELRIYFPERFISDARFVLPTNLNIVSATQPDTRRVNNNEFWWFLVERLGFQAGRTQNQAAIEARLPQDAVLHFRAGFGMP